MKNKQPDKISRAVMDRIIHEEERRIIRFRTIFFAIISVLFVGALVLGLRSYSDLLAQHAFDQFQLFGEDWEIIIIYWREVLDVFLYEIPYNYIILILCLIVLILSIIVLTRRKRRFIHMVEQEITQNNQTPPPDTAGAPTEVAPKTPTKKPNNQTFMLVAISVIVLGISIAAIAVSRMGQNPEGVATPATGAIQPEDNTQTSGSQNVTPAGSDYQGEKVNQISLTVSSPADKSTTSVQNVTVKGKTAANAEVYIDDKELKADAGGNFTTTVTLEEGDNVIVVTAVDENGNVAEKEINVEYTP